jgi:soluble lytic murein transglycosylase-like protein
LIQKSFSDIMTLNRMPSICFTVLAGLLLAGVDVSWAEVITTRSTVRADRQSGRLIRTQVVSPREVPALAVMPVGSPAPKAGPQNESKAAVDRIVEEVSETHGVDPLLAKSVLQVESNYNQFALSPKGAMGLMQLMPATARQLGVSNAYDARQNIEAGVKFLKYLKSQFSDERLVLAAYNAGEGAVRKHGWIPPYPETIDYVYKVGRRYGEAKRSEGAAKASTLKAAGDAAQANGSVAAVPKIQQSVDAEGRIHIQIP